MYAPVYNSPLRAQNEILERNLRVFEESIFVTDNKFTQGSLLGKSSFDRNLLGYFAAFVVRGVSDPTPIQTQLNQFFDEQKRIFQVALRGDFLEMDDQDLTFAIKNHFLLGRMIDIAREKFSTKHAPLPEHESLLKEKLDQLVAQLGSDPSYEEIVPNLKSGLCPIQNSPEGQKLERLAAVFNKFARVPGTKNLVTITPKFKRLAVIIEAKSIIETALLIIDQNKVPFPRNSIHKIKDFMFLISSFRLEHETLNKGIMHTSLYMHRLRNASIDIGKIDRFSKLFPEHKKAFGIFQNFLNYQFSDLPDEAKLLIFKNVPIKDLLTKLPGSSLINKWECLKLAGEQFTEYFKNVKERLAQITANDYLHRIIQDKILISQVLLYPLPELKANEVPPDWIKFKDEFYLLLDDFLENATLAMDFFKDLHKFFAEYSRDHTNSIIVAYCVSTIKLMEIQARPIVFFFTNHYQQVPSHKLSILPNAFTIQMAHYLLKALESIVGTPFSCKTLKDQLKKEDKTPTLT